MQGVLSLGVWGRSRIRRLVGVGAVMGTLLLVGSGCQAITGSYSVPSQPGAVCTALASCCLKLPSAELGACLPVIQAEDESGCASFLLDLGAACSVGARDAGGLTLPDASTLHDATGGNDTGAGSDLTGTWTLTSETCGGTPATLNGTTTLTFSTGSAEEIQDQTGGCVVTETISPLTVTATAISSPSGTLACSEACSANECTAGATGAIDLPYTRTGTTLTLSENVATTTCSTGVYLLNFSME